MSNRRQEATGARRGRIAHAASMGRTAATKRGTLSGRGVGAEHASARNAPSKRLSRDAAVANARLPHDTAGGEARFDRALAATIADYIQDNGKLLLRAAESLRSAIAIVHEASDALSRAAERSHVAAAEMRQASSTTRTSRLTTRPRSRSATESREPC